MLGDLVLYALNLVLCTLNLVLGVWCFVLCALYAETKAPQYLNGLEDDEQSTKF